MKHQKEWRTCDRCGKEIQAKSLKTMDFTRKGDYITPIFEDSDLRGEIHTFKFGFEHVIDLCPKCRIAFQRFMWRSEE